MGLKKAMGILVFSTQAVIGADYYFQTRDAGLGWGDLSATDYGTIVQERFARARTAKEHAARSGGDAGSWDRLAALGSSTSGDQPVCIRRSNEAEC
ncbi:MULTISPECIES: hypothetical protein [unclassified Leisingera]|uniref:hypothetical protein n=1 Tax=unclassified Leisingera TaxID=2614906 RepID=UPI0005808485|nr:MULTISPECIES: hypothetical protein [unclassified Leisingera]KIC17056.1 hypothetical protein RA21_10400 [Leisingera sp. ANG-DT]KIC31150.1 hypothetical protein RA24_00360 [Leisingera sp. ANG-M6]